MGLTLPLVREFRGYRDAKLAMADQQPVVRRPERPQRGEEPRRLEQVRLPLPVRADEKLLPPGKRERGKAHVTKMAKRDLVQPHRGTADSGRVGHEKAPKFPTL